MIPLAIFAVCVVAALLIAWVVVRTMFAVVTVDNASMSPALEHGDRVLLWRHWPAAWLRKGQIVVIRPVFSVPLPVSIAPTTLYIKRITGLGGETLTFPRAETGPGYDEHEHRALQIPPGHIFVRGDNTAHSIDSMTWGPLSQKCVLGVVLLKLPSKAMHQPPPQPVLFQKTALDEGVPAGERAPDFMAETLDGETVTLATYAGRTVMLLFIAPSRLCQEFLPVVETLQPQAMRSGTELVLVCAADADRTRRFVGHLQTTFPILVAPHEKNSFFNTYTSSRFPFYCLIDEHGIVQSSGPINSRGGGWKRLVENWEQDQQEPLS